MNRREFFRRTLPAVAVTVAAVHSGWGLDFFRRLLSRVLRRTADWNEMPLGLIDVMTTQNIHGLSDQHGRLWSVSYTDTSNALVRVLA